MSDQELAPYKSAIASAKEELKARIEEAGTPLVAKEECLFAMQACEKGNFLMQAVQQNPHSLKMALINVGMVGLSLSPATAYAYLVPRDREVCLDISYRGLIKIATDTGSILWAKADVVHENDTYRYRGLHEEPVHEVGSQNSFTEDRGEMVGAYCIAKTSDGDILVEQMSKDQVLKVREASKGAGSKYSPWNNYPEEMWKKVVIKRASKTWPKTDKSERLAQAVEILNEHEGVEFEHEHSGAQWEFYLSVIGSEDKGFDDANPVEYAVFWNSLENEEKLSLLRRRKSMIERGKGRGVEEDRLRELREHGEDEIENIVSYIMSGGVDEAEEAITGFSDDVIDHVYALLPPDFQALISQVREAA
jgi:recombination protein RecT